MQLCSGSNSASNTLVLMVLQRDLHHWIPLLNHFDDYLEKLLYGRTELDLRDLSKPESDTEFPKRNVLSILTTTCTLLRTCLHKQLYNSLEVCSCLALCNTAAHRLMALVCSILAIPPAVGAMPTPCPSLSSAGRSKFSSIAWICAVMLWCHISTNLVFSMLHQCQVQPVSTGLSVCGSCRQSPCCLGITTLRSRRLRWTSC